MKDLFQGFPPIPFWDNEHYFLVHKYYESIGAFLEKKGKGFPFSGKTQSSQKDYFNNGIRKCNELCINPNHTKYIDKQKELSDLSKKARSAEEQKVFERIWRELENNDALIFSTPQLIDIAVEKVSLFEFFILFGICGWGTHHICDDPLLLRYLDSDPNLFQSRPVIEYIKWKRMVQDSKFLGQINTIIKPKNTGKRQQSSGAPQHILDWIFVQIKFCKNYYSSQLSEDDLYREIAKVTKAINPVDIRAVEIKFPYSEKNIEKLFKKSKEVSLLRDFSDIDLQEFWKVYSSAFIQVRLSL